MKKIYSIALILILASTSAYTQDTQTRVNELNALADAYFKAFSDLDIDAMVEFYADSVSYIDETYLDATGNTASLIGKETVHEAFSTQFFPLSRKFVFDEESRFFSGTQGVFKGNITIHYKGNVAGQDESKTLEWTSSYVVVLTIKDGKIIRQNDFIDYAGAKQKWLE